MDRLKIIYFSLVLFQYHYETKFVLFIPDRGNKLLKNCLEQGNNYSTRKKTLLKMANITRNHTGKRKKNKVKYKLTSLFTTSSKNEEVFCFLSFTHTYARTLVFLYILNGIIFWTLCFVYILSLTLTCIRVLKVLSLNLTTPWWTLLNREMRAKTWTLFIFNTYVRHKGGILDLSEFQFELSIPSPCAIT